MGEKEEGIRGAKSQRAGMMHAGEGKREREGVVARPDSLTHCLAPGIQLTRNNGPFHRERE